MISFSCAVKFGHEKSPETAWFRAFSVRYLFWSHNVVAEGGFEPPKALLRCPSHCSLMRRTRRPLRQILLPASATGGGRKICPGLILRSKVQTPFYSKKQSPDQTVEGLFLVRVAIQNFLKNIVISMVSGFRTTKFLACNFIFSPQIQGDC